MAGRKRRWAIESLAPAVAEERSIAGVLRRLGLRAAGANYENIARIIRFRGLSTDHFTGQAHLKGRHNPHARKRPLEQVLVRGSAFQSNHLRKRLIAENILVARCCVCMLTDWLEQPIPLELDHLDGDRENNSLDNLRLICPNCHAMTPTYRGKNVALRRKVKEVDSYRKRAGPGGETGETQGA